MGPSPLLTPPPPPHLPSFSHTHPLHPPYPFQFRTAGCFCGEGMGTQEPGSERVTFQHLALAAPLLLLSLRLDPPFLYSTPALSLSLSRFLSNTPHPQSSHTSLPLRPCSALSRLLIFQYIHFILRPHSLSEVSPERKPHPPPLFCFTAREMARLRGREKLSKIKKEQEKEELEFSYGIE